MKKETNKCNVCKNSIDYKNERKDIEICIEKYDGEIEGKHFCSRKCFDKYVKECANNGQAEGDSPKCLVCHAPFICPSYSFEDYSDGCFEIFCSDKCLRSFLLNKKKRKIKLGKKEKEEIWEKLKTDPYLTMEEKKLLLKMRGYRYSLD